MPAPLMQDGDLCDIEIRLPELRSLRPCRSDGITAVDLCEVRSRYLAQQARTGGRKAGGRVRCLRQRAVVSAEELPAVAGSVTIGGGMRVVFRLADSVLPVGCLGRADRVRGD